MNINKIKKMQVEARKTRNKVVASILTLVIGEYETAVKGGREKSVSEIVEKLIKSNKEVISKKATFGIDTEIEQLEVDFLIGLLPAKASAEEISQFLDETIFSSIPEAFKALDGKFGKNYDKAVASRIIRGKL